MRVAYLSGPVDAKNAYDAWTENLLPGYFGSSHITDFFQICADLNADGYVITTLDTGHSRTQAGRFLIENRPAPSKFSGILFHLTQMLWLARMLPAIAAFRPDVLIVTAGQNYWPILAVLKLLGTAIIPVYTCTLWLKFKKPKAHLRLLLTFNKFFLRHCVAAVVTASEEISRQVRAQLDGEKLPVTVFLPVYRRDQFAMFEPAPFDARPFRIFFAGRIERNKGVYDLVTIAQQLSRDDSFAFDICGEGSELQALRKKIADLELTKTVTCHGFCERSKLSAILQEAHIVIVPTRTEFEEGYNMVCSEAILANRPLISSEVCPAIEYIRDASIEVPPNDAAAYRDAILQISGNRDLYEAKVNACRYFHEQFYTVGNGWGAKVREAIEQHAIKPALAS